MNAAYAIRVVAVLNLFCSLVFADETRQLGATLKGEVTKIVDGDGIWFREEQMAADEKLKIRSHNIDAPELHFPNAEGKWVAQQPFGSLSFEALKAITPKGTEVKLRDRGQDANGRTLGRIYVGKKDINLEMVKLGWAVPYIICEGPNCTPGYFHREGVESFLAACKSARADGNGIFDPAKPLKEMPYTFRWRERKTGPQRFVGDYTTKQLFAPKDWEKVDLCDRIFFNTEEDAIRAGFDY